MNPTKILALALVVGGVSVCASFGARLSPPMRAELAADGAASLSAGRAKAALEAYCGALKGADRPLEPTCPGYVAPADAPAPVPAAGPAPATEADHRAAGAARVAAWRAAAPGDLPEALQAPRADWIAAAEAAVGPAAARAVRRPTPPSERLSSWFADSGLPFLLGLVAVVVGAVLARRVQRAEALSEAPVGGRPGGPVDFGALLATLRAELEALRDGLAAEDPGPAGRLPVRERLEGLQRERFEPLVGARGRLQARYGLAAYAEIFGPLSAAERRVNRAWTALVDQHWPEARDSVIEAARQLEAAEAALRGVVAAA